MFKHRTIEVAGCPHKPGDVLSIDDDKWVVVKTDFTGSWSKVWLEPLFMYVARHITCAHVHEQDMCILDYLQKLCDEYEESCRC